MSPSICYDVWLNITQTIMALIMLTMKDADRYTVIKQAISGQFTVRDAAKILNLSGRQIKRLKKQVRKDGAKGVIHGNRGNPSHNKLPTKETQEIITLLHKYYADFNPGLATEKLTERHQITHDPKTIRALMIQEKLWHSKRKKVLDYHSWRPRRSSFGELEQYDGSYEYWFENRGQKCCLLLAVDDATGDITHARFDKDEGTIPTFNFWWEYLAKHGKPVAIYCDKFSTYNQNQETAKLNEDSLTQFQRAMKELCIGVIPANSAQAKGRVENRFGTLQNRLIKELRLEGISTIVAGNKFLEEKYNTQYNKKFSVAPRSKRNLHRRLTRLEEKQLPSILCRKYERIIQNDFTISYETNHYQLLEEQPVTILKKNKVTVEDWVDGTIHFKLRGKELNYKVLPIGVKKMPLKTKWVIAKTVVALKPAQVHRPAENHPWRKFQFGKSNSVKIT